ncbi:McrC family protein [Deinococcus sp. NW-56]|uniref:McrC family protein n=1 Tax=Deinococcus sp. NW-56 TaxID=2080419 RepID=UPI000CF39D04|nr:McrC family protein [Deinococcus sp. NW-56]
MSHVVAREHDLVVRESGAPVCLPGAAFDALLEVVEDPELNPVAVPVLHRGQLAVKLTQWVGAVQLPDGTVLEILPKTHARGDDVGASRDLLLRMLAAVDARFRVAPPTALDPARMPLFEVFLSFALEGFRAGVGRGVPHRYAPVREERSSFKGRLDATRQVRQPLHRAHLLHVEYDEYLPDRPETRLVRLSVERIARLTGRQDTRRLAQALAHVLEGVPASGDPRRDERAWSLERGYRHFEALRGYCRLILHELNPVVRGQATTSFAVLFDMNVLYERYVAFLLRQKYPGWTIDTQRRGEALATSGGDKAFPVRPDLYVKTTGGEVIVADTKWKRLDPTAAPAYGISNADAYQLLAYSEVFQGRDGRRDVVLLYPELPGLPRRFGPLTLPSGSALHVQTVPLHDLPAFMREFELAGHVEAPDPGRGSP